MESKSFQGNLSVSVKIFLHLAFIGLVIIIQALMNNYNDNVVKYDYETLVMQKEALSIHREELGYKALQAKLLYKNYIDDYTAKNFEDDGQEFGILLKEIDSICDNNFIHFDNEVGLTTAQIKDTIQTIRSDLLNLNNKKTPNNKNKILAYKLHSNHGIDTILSKIANKNIIALYDNILQAEYTFLKREHNKEAYDNVIHNYNLLKEAISSKISNPKLKEELSAKLSIKYEELKKIAYIMIDIDELTTRLEGSINKLIQLDRELQEAIDEGTKDKIIDARSLRDRLNNLIYFLNIFSIIQIIISFFIIRSSIIEPLKDVVEAAQEIALGNVINLSYLENKDEIGKITQSLKILQEANMARYIAETTSKKEEVSIQTSNHELQKMKVLTLGFKENIQYILNEILNDSNILCNTSEDISSSFNATINIINNVINSSETTSQNIQVVASATEELSASVKEIAAQATNSTGAFRAMVEKAEKADVSITNLSQAAKEISSVIELITDITEQINLLALNATIESARAGQAGRGFAVVASEIKNLASETTKATEQIFKQVEGIQVVSKSVVNGLKDIKNAIDNVNQYSSSIASAVEEQSSVTAEIAGNMNNASKITVGIKDNIKEININASQAQNNTGQLVNSSKSLYTKLSTLQTSIDKFLTQLNF
ncbi:MAG: putative methyl-accepting chemotaxis receptor/sensory transducer [Rickettsiaceae bacterium]|jgi:methyl-accepting chemotaxis protein|nr:putative methyl-accepting chemotaxis receptor/sensory transducer [Rickettsiaceae bacterium]